MSAARERRNRQNVYTLVGALLASFGIVLVLVLLTVRPDPISRAEVDWHSLAATESTGVELVDPFFTESDGDWWANRADFTGGASPEWYIGLITPAMGFVSVQQFPGTVSAEVAEILDDVDPQTVTIGGSSWERYDRSTRENPGNYRTVYRIALTDGGILVVSGTADSDEIELAASRALDSVTAQPTGED